MFFAYRLAHNANNIVNHIVNNVTELLILLYNF